MELIESYERLRSNSRQLEESQHHSSAIIELVRVAIGSGSHLLGCTSCAVLCTSCAHQGNRD